MDVTLFNCAGWSQMGGVWIKPEESMRYLVTAEQRVSGPSKVSAKLPEILVHSPAGKLTPSDLVQDVTVLAFPAPREGRDRLAGAGVTIKTEPPVEGARNWLDNDRLTFAEVPVAKDGSPTVIELTTEKPFTARSLTFRLPWYDVERKRGSGGCFDADCELLVKAPDGSFRSVRKFEYRRQNFTISSGPLMRGPVSISFPEITGTCFRIVMNTIKKHPFYNKLPTYLDGIELSGAPRLERFVEQQLGKTYPGIFPPWDYYLFPGQAEADDAALCVKAQDIRNLNEYVNKDGLLTWDVPDGDWVVLRVAMMPTGRMISPAAKEATGLEVDKMSPVAVKKHFDAYVGKLLKQMPAADRKALRGVSVDSYEAGPQNWTDDAREQFMKAYGYDPLPWLTTLTGRVVGSVEQSERFLWDLRRLVADRIAATYGAFQEVASGNGLEFWLEPYGHFGFPAEFLQLGGRADGVGGEFWLNPKHGDMEVRAGVSSGHIYGKQKISSEAFTGTPSYGYTQDPWTLKPIGDLAQAWGINHFVLHVYIHQTDDRKPGMNAWFGTEFNRNNTWFDKGQTWIDYLRRSHFLLQHGCAVADVAYFIGEDAPKMSGIQQPALPEGYSFDYVNGEVIRERMKEENGRFVLPGGMSYALLVLPPLDMMRPELLKKIRDLVAAGGAVLGAPPVRSPSLQNYPKADEEVRQLARELWGDLNGKENTSRKFGKGWVFQGLDVQASLNKLGVKPSIAGLEVEAKPREDGYKDPLPWTHRTLPDGSQQFMALRWQHRSSAEGEIFYIANQADKRLSVSPSFRVEGKQPELWDPVTAEHRLLPDFAIKDGRTVVPLEFGPRESLFVLFRKSAHAAGGGKNLPSYRTVKELTGPWSVSFDPQWGGPKSVVFEKLENWLDRSEEGIRNYGGTAVYTKTFDLPKLEQGKTVHLNLGNVRSLASIRLNGRDLGVIWCYPWRLEITSAAKSGQNKLEIEVTNTWVNRLLADTKLPEEKRLTYVARSAIRAQKPQASGLFGPVVIEMKEE
ncbi:MAG: glycosyl hydrolase [bacterium]